MTNASGWMRSVFASCSGYSLGCGVTSWQKWRHSKESHVPFPLSLKLLNEAMVPRELELPAISCLKTKKAEFPDQQEEGLLFLRKSSHNSDSFSGHLAKETGAETKMGQNWAKPHFNKDFLVMDHSNSKQKPGGSGPLRRTRVLPYLFICPCWHSF